SHPPRTSLSPPLPYIVPGSFIVAISPAEVSAAPPSHYTHRTLKPMSASPPAGSPALQAYRTLREFRSAEIVIKRSRFIGWGSPVETEEAALELLNQIRAEHPQATHHCYAYRVGLGTESVRFSDDG